MFKKGDKVYSILRGWGEVIECDSSPYGFPVKVDFGNGIVLNYTQQGKMYSAHLHPELYHTEPVITVHKRRVEHTGWIAVNNDNSLGFMSCSHIHHTKEQCELHYKEEKGYIIQQITYYTEE